ncbi:MerR family transcriptional regulator [Micromonospora sp. Llam0]|uniref:helix-turn-helix domain-containing protein n=1 Tax=Micromonospora sp. Llam0 TaxID=2485143 RepID=UPI0018F444E1|nr:MerR family transcriptional regulator [Micromonospora sp. Llam0]
MQIGEVAERTGLSLRTIRYYEEVGVVVPSARSQGGFRLYTDADVDRLQLVKRMRLIDCTLEQTRDLLDLLDQLARPSVRLSETERVTLAAQLRAFHAVAQDRTDALAAQLKTIKEFSNDLAEHLKTIDTRPVGQPFSAEPDLVPEHSLDEAGR